MNRISKREFPLAYHRARKILSLNESRRDIQVLVDPTRPLLGREDLLLQQVKAVLFTIEAGIAATSLQGVFAKDFVQHLEPRHIPPQNMAYMRIVRILELAFYHEYFRLIADNIVWLGSNFASTNSDFYRNPERRESYGCIVATMAAKRYNLKNGRTAFISTQTLNEGKREILACEAGQVEQLETVNSFKRFDAAHTGKGIGAWLAKEHESKGLLPQYVGYHCTDGASNAVASVNEYELLTEINRETPINHQKCLAHQTNRSAKYASGTGDFVNCANKLLRDVLGKAHTIIARVHRSSSRIEVMRNVQRTAKRLHVAMPSPGVTTRWDSANREVASLNRVMGDYSKGLHILITGNDRDKLVGRDGVPVPATDFTFTPADKLILRQFECGSEPCVSLSKFYQLNAATSHETLFVMAAYLAVMCESSFVMYDDISHSDLLDLSARKKTVYVLSSTHVATEEENGRNTQPMDVCIETFRRLYANDMEERCGFREDGLPTKKLPVETAIALLLNPLYGGKLFCCFVLMSFKYTSN